MNLANLQPRHVSGEYLQYVDEMEHYGRAV